MQVDLACPLGNCWEVGIKRNALKWGALGNPFLGPVFLISHSFQLKDIIFPILVSEKGKWLFDRKVSEGFLKLKQAVFRCDSCNTFCVVFFDWF